ncbi:hypothetical protein OROHE_014082 [Orobanche hederae]
MKLGSSNLRHKIERLLKSLSCSTRSCDYSSVCHHPQAFSRSLSSSDYSIF